MRKKIPFIALAFFLPSLMFARAGNDKITVAVANFTSGNDADAVNASVTSMLKQLVIKELNTRNGFTLLPTAVTSKMEQDVAGQTDEATIYSKLSDDAQQNGALYVITSKLTQNSEQTPQELSNPGDPNSAQVTRYVETITFSLNLIDVITGQVVTSASDSYTCASKAADANSAFDADYALAACKIKFAVLKMFPFKIHILKFDQVDKKGVPKTVIIDQGESFFSRDMTKGGDCVEKKPDPKKIEIPDWLKKKKSAQMDVILIDTLVVNGKSYPQQKTIGKLELLATQGPDLSTCTVREGDKEIKENFGKNLMIKLIMAE